MALRDWFKTEHRTIGEQPEIGKLAASAQDGLSGSVMSEQRSFADDLAYHLNAKGLTANDVDLQIFPGRGYSRNRATAYIALNRCVQIISGACAQLLCGGELKVIDRDGRTKTNERIDAMMDLFTGSYDGGENPTRYLIEDAMADYALDGNALLEPIMGPRSKLIGFKRYQTWDASRLQNYMGGPRHYLVQEADTEHRTIETVDARDMIHVRFPLLYRQGNSNSSRLGFANSPVTEMKEALQIGQHGDKYILEWFSRGVKSGVHINITKPEGVNTEFTAEARKEIADELTKAARSGLPIVTFNGQTSNITDTPQDSEAGGLREFQVQEIARFFGIPLPLLSVALGQWGSAVNEQIGKLAWLWGLKLHMNRLLSGLQIKLLMDGERFMVDPSEFTRGDAEGMQKLLMALGGSAQAAPIATREEMRHLAGLGREPDGEFHAPMAPVEGEETTETEEGGAGVSPAPMRVAAIDEGVASLEDVLAGCEGGA